MSRDTAREEARRMARNRDWTAPRPQKLTMLRNVSVCSSCKRASCAQGTFPCQSPSRALLLPIETMRFMDREREEFWSEEWAQMAKARTA